MEVRINVWFWGLFDVHNLRWAVSKLFNYKPTFKTNGKFWFLRFEILKVYFEHTLRNICSDKTLIEKIKYKTPVDVRAISFQLITHSKSHCVLSG